MKKEAQQFRWAALPMRDILNPIIRGDIALFPAEEIVYFRDIYDHAVRVIDQLDSMRDLVNSSLEIHLSVVANRQNEVAKQLTIIATIFLPLSFIVGFFGQNFLFLTSNIQSTGSFWLLGIGCEVVAVTLMIYYFKRKGWF
jgi:magnesium transporter